VSIFATAAASLYGPFWFAFGAISGMLVTLLSCYLSVALMRHTLLVDEIGSVPSPFPHVPAAQSPSPKNSNKTLCSKPKFPQAMCLKNLSSAPCPHSPLIASSAVKAAEVGHLLLAKFDEMQVDSQDMPFLAWLCWLVDVLHPALASTR
jgi:hypothetical protein